MTIHTKTIHLIAKRNENKAFKMISESYLYVKNLNVSLYNKYIHQFNYKIYKIQFDLKKILIM